MATLLQDLATLAFRRRRAFLAAWLLVIVATLGCYATFGSTINSDFMIPGSSSQNASDELRKTLRAAACNSAQIVFESPTGTRITAAKYHSAVEATLDQARHAPGRGGGRSVHLEGHLQRRPQCARRDRVHRERLLA
jgi:putative drug exporter of the RND superfamily